MTAIKAIYNGVNFKPLHPVPVKGSYEVVITFLEPIKTKMAVRPPFEYGSMTGKMRMADDFDAPLKDFEEYM